MSGGPQRMRNGGIRQTGIPWAPAPGPGSRGMLLRGVVTATYVIDDPAHPYADSPSGHPLAVYCDVLVYSSGPWAKAVAIPRCLVSQDTGGMQRGRVWKPRATTKDVTGNNYNPQVGTNPANMDGDHVLIGFMDDEFNQPVILRGIPHPSMDLGHAEDETAGHRLKLVLADGDPDFHKHHGSFYGVTDLGDFLVDTTAGNNGSLSSTGDEPDPPTDGTKGNQLYKLEQHAKRLLQFMDMTDPTAPQSVMSELVSVLGYVLDFMANTPSWQVKAGANNAVSVQGSGATATLALGNGAVHVAIAEHLQAMWTAFVTLYSAHVHTGGTLMGALTGTPVVPGNNWDPTINSTKISLPDG